MTYLARVTGVRFRGGDSLGRGGSLCVCVFFFKSRIYLQVLGDLRKSEKLGCPVSFRDKYGTGDFAQTNSGKSRLLGLRKCRLVTGTSF